MNDRATVLKSVVIDNVAGRITSGIRLAVGGPFGTIVFVEVVDAGTEPLILSFDSTETQDPRGAVFLLPIGQSEAFVLAPRQTLYVNALAGEAPGFICYNVYDLDNYDAASFLV